MRKIGQISSFLIPVIAFVALVVFMTGCERQKKAKEEENKAITLRAEELWNTGNLTIADEIYATDFVNHDPNAPDVRDLESYKGFIGMIRTGLPDFHVTIEDLVTEGDKVASRWTARGTHQGEFFGIPPTGKQATWTGITIYRFAGGKIVEAWWIKDVMGLLQQLGVIPPPGQAEK
jgi:steroid delta-isomerase-like uncharacterized protein